MEEITIRLKRNTLYVMAALIIGLGLGYGGANLLREATGQAALQNTNQQLAPNNNAANNNADNNAGNPALSKIILTKHDHTRGGKNPSVILVEFSDFQCPYCAKVHPTLERVLTEYGDGVAWVYRHFPLSFHESAGLAAEASECAGEQGKFWEFADRIFSGSEFSKQTFQNYAKELGINTSAFNSCLDSGKYTEKVNADMSSGMSAGVNGTPGTVLIDKNGNQQIISGALPYEQFKAVIDAALK